MSGDMFESVPSGGDAIFMKVCLPLPPPIFAGISLWTQWNDGRLTRSLPKNVCSFQIQI